MSWMERRSNANNLETIEGRRERLATVWKRQMTFLWDVMRANGLENLAITGLIAKSRSRGEPREKYLERMNEILGGGITT